MEQLTQRSLLQNQRRSLTKKFKSYEVVKQFQESNIELRTVNPAAVTENPAVPEFNPLLLMINPQLPAFNPLSCVINPLIVMTNPLLADLNLQSPDSNPPAMFIKQRFPD